MSFTKIVFATTGGFLVGFLCGYFYVIKLNNIKLSSDLSSDNTPLKKSPIINEKNDELLKLLDSQHNSKDNDDTLSNELYYFGPQPQLSNRLDNENELAILRKFEIIEGRRFNIANDIVRVSGYTLHPVYINDDTKNKLKEYNEKIIGVRVKDVRYDSIKKKMSSFAIVEKILDVGGQDDKNRGLEL